MLNYIVRYNYQIIKLQIEIFITSHVLIVDMTINESKALYSPNNYDGYYLNVPHHKTTKIRYFK